MKHYSPLVRWMLWLSLSSAVVIYFIVLQLNSDSRDLDDPAQTEEAPLKMIFYVVGLAMFAASQGIRIIVNRVRGEDGKPMAPAWIDTAYVIALALAETPAILGLVLGFQGASGGDYLPLFIASLVGMALISPRMFFPPESSTATVAS
ncbi:MAG: hypothetical protein AAGA96_17670 [Verrucomicrobiota bacterium]